MNKLDMISVTCPLYSMAEDDIKAGHEVLHSYGDLSDAELLTIYGFVDSDDNVNNNVIIPYQCILDSCSIVAQKQVIFIWIKM